MKLSEVENSLQLVSKYTNLISENNDLYHLAIEENDSSTITECNHSILKIIEDLEAQEFKLQFKDEADSKNCYLEIHAGAGGTESQDWAQMLLRMYLRWAEKKNFKATLIHESFGEEAGIKSSTLLIEGSYAFGYLKKESGIHRLVRISPFDSNSRRHTSFSSVWISPYVDENIEVNINDKDLRIDTFRASGAGGQHVNTTDSAIRITHEPTGIVVQCQNERSQHKNKDTCFKMLKARLYEYELQKREQENQKATNLKTDIGWGHQIRSYVLQPYQLVKDLRNKTENTNPDAVLNGDIDSFIEAGVLNK